MSYYLTIYKNDVPICSYCRNSYFYELFSNGLWDKGRVPLDLTVLKNKTADIVKDITKLKKQKAINIKIADRLTDYNELIDIYDTINETDSDITVREHALWLIEFLCENSKYCYVYDKETEREIPNVWTWDIT